MSNEEKTTLQMILSAAIQEFLEKGFTSASLRNIAKKAGVTTGALYGYYDSKEDLFEALVGEHYNFLLERFCKAQKEFAEIPLKSLILGIATLNNLYAKSYILPLLNVTLHPILIPSLILKAAIAFFAFVIIGF